MIIKKIMVHYMPKEKVKLAYWLLDCMIMIHHQCVKKTYCGFTFCWIQIFVVFSVLKDGSNLVCSDILRTKKKWLLQTSYSQYYDTITQTLWKIPCWLFYVINTLPYNTLNYAIQHYLAHTNFLFGMSKFCSKFKICTS